MSDETVVTPPDAEPDADLDQSQLEQEASELEDDPNEPGEFVDQPNGSGAAEDTVVEDQ